MYQICGIRISGGNAQKSATMPQVRFGEKERGSLAYGGNKIQNYVIIIL